MKKMMLIAVGALALGTLAQTAIPQPVTLEKNKIPAVPSSTPATVQEYAPGALCRVYRVDANRNADRKTILEALNSNIVALDQEYDSTSEDFDGQKVNKHRGNLVVWEGLFLAKRAGTYTILLSDRENFAQIEIGDGIFWANGTGRSHAFTANLAKGANKIKVIMLVKDRYQWSAPLFEYRPTTSTKPPKKITPKMLRHVVEDEEEW